MRAVSQEFLDTVNKPHKVITKVTIKVPNGSTKTLKFESGSVSAQSGAGNRRTATLELPAVSGLNLYDLVSTPGSIFKITHGFQYNAGQSELIPIFDGEATSGSSSLEDGSVSLSLTDRWTRVERCRFLSPISPPGGYRSIIAGNLITQATGTLPTNLTDKGGSSLGLGTFDRDRAQAVKDLCTDGGFEAYIDCDSTIVTRPVPTLDPSLSVWTVRSGEGGTFKSGSRVRPFDRLYNTVVVSPSDDKQVWSRVIVMISDPSHPRHPDKIGIVPYFWSSPTIPDPGSASKSANAILSRILGVTETVSTEAISNPALEPGDIITLLKGGRQPGQSFTASHIIDTMSVDLVTGGMTLNTRSSAYPDVEESG